MACRAATGGVRWRGAARPVRDGPRAAPRERCVDLAPARRAVHGTLRVDARRPAVLRVLLARRPPLLRPAVRLRASGSALAAGPGGGRGRGRLALDGKPVRLARPGAAGSSGTAARAVLGCRAHAAPAAV